MDTNNKKDEVDLCINLFEVYPSCYTFKLGFYS